MEVIFVLSDRIKIVGRKPDNITIGGFLVSNLNIE